MTATLGVVHVAGLAVGYDTLIRQRCAWCGQVILADDLALIDEPPALFPTWPVGELIEVCGDRRSATVVDELEWSAGDAVPENCCLRLDPAVTL